MSYDKRRWIQVTVPLTPEEHERVQEKAREEERSVANFARMALVRAAETFSVHLKRSRP